jgi:hypothetical protein
MLQALPRSTRSESVHIRETNSEPATTWEIKKRPFGRFLFPMLRMWDDIRTWIMGQKAFVFPEVVVSVPSESEYLAWRKLTTA